MRNNKIVELLQESHPPGELVKMNVPSLARDKESSIEPEKPEFYAGKGRGIMEPGIIGIYMCVSNKVSLSRKVKKKKEKKRKKERSVRSVR